MTGTHTPPAPVAVEPLRVVRPRSLAEALRLAGALEGPVHYLAGGTDLAVARRAGGLPEAHTVVLHGIPELRGIEHRDGAVRIGALVTMAELLADPTVRVEMPLLAASLADFASPQIRAMATLGGNISNGSPAADTVPPLLVLEAELELASSGGTRKVPLASFFTGYRRNVLRHGEIVAATLVKPADFRFRRSAWRKVGSRAAVTIAKLSVAAALRVEGGHIAEARLAVGSLNEYPRRIPALESLLRGADPRDVTDAEVRAAVLSTIAPISDFRSDSAYRTEVCVKVILDLLADGGNRQSPVPE